MNLSAGSTVWRLGVVLALSWTVALPATDAASEPAPMELYERLKAFALGGEAVRVEKLVLKRDRIEMRFTGEFYPAEPIAGRVYGVVFLGKGQLRVEPWSLFEKENVRRFLKADVVEVTFTRAVLRFSDDTYERVAAGAPAKPTARDRAQKLAAELEKRLVRETGLNLSARLALAVLNQDEPGVFFGQFDGGKPGRFCALLDHQARVPANIFEVNGGEKGLLFQYKGPIEGNDIWTAFYNEEDFKRRRVAYSDVFDLVEIPDYRMEVDLRDPGDWLRIEGELDLVALHDGVRLIPMSLNEGLDEYDDERLKKGLRVVSAALADGTEVGVIQEDWETGFSLALPRALAKGERASVKLRLEGKDSLWTWQSHFHYPRSTTTWYPRHGYLARSRFDITFRHKKNRRVVSVGERVREGPAEDNEKEWLTQWVMKESVALVTFAVGPLERHTENAEVAGEKVPIEFYSVSGAIQQIKEDFVLAELINGVHYFSDLYGDYSYGRLGAVYFPTRFGQGFPSLLLLPVEGYARTREFAFIAHEGAHQWWGNIVGWRSYRDQWLSEGFAEYSGVLYTAWRKKKPKEEVKLVKEMRRSLMNPPRTDTGIASGKLYEVGPLVLGHRLSTRRSRGAYTTLIYNKGCLVLRMLHFLLSNPATGEDKGFFDMMKEFVAQHRNGWATTESFLEVASRYFAASPIGRKYGLKDLNWFLRQWVYQTGLPSYRLEYRVEPRAGGGVVLRGTLYQEGVPENWFMPLPLLVKFSGKREARGTIHALGRATPVELPLPEPPKKVLLDPELWVLSEKTSEKRGK
ncbi:MAG: M1 family metallopeptidase [Terriglobia bacterium]